MGMYHSTYFAYGLRIPTDAHPWEEVERIDAELAKAKDRCPDVGHLTVGDYDADMLFLVTESARVDLGEYGRASLATPEQIANWGHQLAFAIHHLGYHRLPGLEMPDWLCIPDLS